MTKYEKIILLSDLDGTLLDSNSKVSVENQQAIKAFIAGGGHFGIATGRSQLNAVAFLDHVEINTPSILYNGCALYDFATKKFLALYKLPNKELEKYLRYCLKEFENVVIQAYCPDMNYIISPEKSADPRIVSDHQPCVFCQIEDIIEEHWIKILFSGKPEDLKAMENKIKDFGIEEKISRVFSSEIYLEFLPPLVSKGSMLPELRECMGTGYKIYAVGDYNNDREMLLAADVGIATRNALQGIKDIADMITVSNDESAIADIIYHLI